MESPRPTIKAWRFAAWVYLAAFAVWVFYTYMNLTGPPDSLTAVQIGTFRMELLRLSIVLPVLVIWMIALRGAVRFKQYAQAIRESADGRALNLISTGLLLLVVYIMMISVFSSIVALAVGTPYLSTVISLRNHLPVSVALVSLALIYVGSERLNLIVRSHTWTLKRFVGAFLPFCMLAGIFCWAFYASFSPLDAHGLPRFTLPLEVLMFSYVLPHLLGWMLGLLAALNIANYGRRTQGMIYKQAFSNLSIGILGVVISLMVVQIFGISAAILAKLPLASLVLLVYALLILAGIGFMYIYRGAQKMELLETAELGSS